MLQPAQIETRWRQLCKARGTRGEPHPFGTISMSGTSSEFFFYEVALNKDLDGLLALVMKSIENSLDTFGVVLDDIYVDPLRCEATKEGFRLLPSYQIDAGEQLEDTDRTTWNKRCLERGARSAPVPFIPGRTVRVVQPFAISDGNLDEAFASALTAFETTYSPLDVPMARIYFESATRRHDRLLVVAWFDTPLPEGELLIDPSTVILSKRECVN